MPGFKEQTTKLTLSVNQAARVDFKLEVGGQTETIEVTGTAPLIEKSTSFIGTVIDSSQVEDLPLNGRNFTQLATLAPGVTRGIPGSNASGGSGEAETFRYGEVGGGAISVNGLREQFNNFQLDGTDNNETLVNSIAYYPSPEAIQEFRVITTNAPAEFGRAGGAITNLVTKSGGNAFHGSAWEFNRAKWLAATPTFATSKPDFSQNDFGATLGGPIKRDQTFFFLAYHGLKSTIPRGGRRQGHCADREDAERRLLRAARFGGAHHHLRSCHGAALPGQRDSGIPDQSRGAALLERLSLAGLARRHQQLFHPPREEQHLPRFRCPHRPQPEQQRRPLPARQLLERQVQRPRPQLAARVTF